ncbi:MAG TPA: POTRA domain-containing protein, partial [Kofleriaceae bacterium]|nr:POTRA domain-containing protein [Kofleriaceae bacterium]
MRRFILAGMLLALLAPAAWAQDDDDAAPPPGPPAPGPGPAPGDEAPPITDAINLLGKRVDAIRFKGNRKVEDDAVLQNLVTQIGSPLDLSRVREDIRAMWKMGFFEQISAEAEASPQGGVFLWFVVTEKPSVRKILVSGNEGVELDKINEVLDLKRDAILDVAKIKQNQQKIQDLYIEKGYYLAKIDFEVKPVNEAEVDVWFIIDESSKVEIRDVTFIGNKKISDAELEGVISTKKGGALSFLSDSGVFSQEVFERDLMMVTAYYYDRGFLNVKLGTPQIRLSRDKRYMYLSITIDEGPVFSIGKIDFKGELIGPKADYYTRLTVASGDVFNRSKVGSDINKLNDYYKDKGYAYVNITPLTNIDLEKRIV